MPMRPVMFWLSLPKLTLSMISLYAISSLAFAQSPAKKSSVVDSKKSPTVARLFWQDLASQSLKWGDLVRDGDTWLLQANAVEGFPAIDSERQNLVQMEAVDGLLLTGIRDDEGGKLQSGWVTIECGVEIESHGDHTHRYYRQQPKITAKRLDAEQGNPAHIYRYSEQFVIANDSKNGFTLVDPKLARTGAANAAQFFSGGGNHITLAMCNQAVVYATWADREGENMGRVDVVGVGSTSRGKSYSIRLASGGIHGAIENSGRVFFAPSDGIDSLRADIQVKTAPPKDALEHMSLGVDPESKRPNRTGAFINHRNYVLFTYGAGASSKLGMIDASEPKLKLRELSLPTGQGLSLVTPKSIVTPSNQHFAFVMQDRKQSESQERVQVINLDPNGDKNFSDAAVVASIDLGPSKIQGHSGHHDICFLPERPMACISNPGDGTIWLVSLRDFTVVGKLHVGGEPGRLIAQ